MIAVLASRTEPSRDRIDFLDGMRGVAIFVVLLYHAYARWPELYVYGGQFVGNPIIDTKIAGVNLFFMVSGFVILMTLRKCEDFAEFLVRRWYRLFPAMLICSLLVLATSGLFPERPRGSISLWDLLPGLTFIGDGTGTHHLWGMFANEFGVHISGIEGAFWSLYVEVRFYLVFGLAYFILGERLAVGLIGSLFVLGQLTSTEILSLHFGQDDVGGNILASVHRYLFATGADWISVLLTSKTYGFFTTGALFFLFYVTQERKFFWLAALIGLLSNLFPMAESSAANCGMTLLFVLVISVKAMRRLLSNSLFLAMGFVSYPLYLLHENMLVAMIVKVGRWSPDLPAVLIPVLPICIVVGLAWVIVEYIEPRTRRLLQWRLIGVWMAGARQQKTMSVPRNSA